MKDNLNTEIGNKDNREFIKILINEFFGFNGDVFGVIVGHPEEENVWGYLDKIALSNGETITVGADAYQQGVLEEYCEQLIPKKEYKELLKQFDKELM